MQLCGADGQLVAHSVLVEPTVQAPPLELLELDELLLDEELELLDDELFDELELLLELLPDTVTEKSCVLCAPQLLV